MRVFTLVDNREVDRYPNMKIFENYEDADNMRKSMKGDSHHFDIHEEEMIK